ncbi:hypothetical protein BpHYR1_045198, partial [Brachionus plicatilis]
VLFSKGFFKVLLWKGHFYGPFLDRSLTTSFFEKIFFTDLKEDFLKRYFKKNLCKTEPLKGPFQKRTVKDPSKKEP